MSDPQPAAEAVRASAPLKDEQIRALVKDIDFAIDLTIPREAMLARFEDAIRSALGASRRREVRDEQPTKKPFRLDVTKEWCEKMATLEEGHDVTAGAEVASGSPVEALRQKADLMQRARERISMYDLCVHIPCEYDAAGECRECGSTRAHRVISELLTLVAQLDAREAALRTLPDGTIQSWIDRIESVFQEGVRAAELGKDRRSPYPLESLSDHWWTRGYAYMARMLRVSELESRLRGREVNHGKAD